MDIVLVSTLKMSARSLHLLQRMQIHTVAEFVNVPIEVFESQKGIGRKTINELWELQQKIKNGQLNAVRCEQAEAIDNEDKDLIYGISDDMLKQLERFPISELNLSVRSQNGLSKGKVLNMHQLVVMADADFEALPSLGKKSIDEIKRARDLWLKDNRIILSEDNNICIPDEKKEFYSNLAENLYMIVPVDARVLYSMCFENNICDSLEVSDIAYLTKNNYICILEKIEILKKGLERYFVDCFSIGKEYIDKESLFERIDNDFKNEELKSAVYDILSYRDGLKIIGSRYVLRRESIEHYIDNLEKKDRTQIILDRLEGMSLQEIGEKNNITRERVRQISVKSISKFPLLWEDYYSEVFSYFKFNKSDFFNVFPNADYRTFDYLSIKYIKGDNDLNRESIDRYDGLFSEIVKASFDKNESEKWKRSLTRQKIAWRILIMNSGKYFDRESFATTYSSFLEEHGLDKERYSLNTYSINNVFRVSKHVVFDREGRFRYYENDAFEIWKIIDFSRYKDMVISSELIYRDYLDTMESFDVWNGYELFCILKNSANDFSGEHTDITFRRIPMMIVGNGDEKKQIIKFVKEIAPIDYWDFFDAYEERYGLRKESAIANLASHIEQYHTNGKYIVDLPQLSKDDEDRIRPLLAVKPLWSIEELEQLFEEACESSGSESLNNTTLYSLGFSLNVGYAYSRKYANVTECFDDYIFSKDLVDVNDLDPEIVRLSAFKSYIYQMRTNLKYIEIAPKIYASMDFLNKEYGLTEEIAKEIQRKTSYYYENKYFNANSLWDKIKKEPYIELLKDNKWLCTSIMRQQEGVFSVSVVGAVILSTDRDALSVSKICSWVVAKEGKMSLEHLTERVNTLFGSNFDKYKIAFKIKEQGDEDKLLTDGVDEYLEQLIAATDSDSDDDYFKEEFF